MSTHIHPGHFTHYFSFSISLASSSTSSLGLYRRIVCTASVNASQACAINFKGPTAEDRLKTKLVICANSTTSTSPDLALGPVRSLDASEAKLQ